MKTKLNAFILTICLFLFAAQGVSAQSFWKKLEQIGKEILETPVEESPSTSTKKTQVTKTPQTPQVSQVSQPQSNVQREKMTGWASFGLANKVKKVTYSTGITREFNTYGNLTKEITSPTSKSEYTYVSKTRFKNQYGDYYDIRKKGNERYERWDSGSHEELGKHFFFDANDRIIEYSNGNYGSGVTQKYTYAKSTDYFPSQMIEDYYDDGGYSSKSTYVYAYLAFDEKGNWTKRQVNIEIITTEEDWDTGKSTTKKETESYIETATYLYF